MVVVVEGEARVLRWFVWLNRIVMLSAVVEMESRVGEEWDESLEVQLK